MTERHERGLLDTSVLVGLEAISEVALPVHTAIAAITFAELAAGVHLAKDAAERGARLVRLQAVEATFEQEALELAGRWDVTGASSVEDRAELGHPAPRRVQELGKHRTHPGLGEVLGEELEHAERDGVAAVRPVEGEGGDVTVDLVQDIRTSGLVRHGR